MNIYEIEITKSDKTVTNLKQYEGYIMLFVNTATRCGFTPQYDELQALYDQYKEQKFIILDFPCNQFMKQAPGSIEEINNFCTLNFNIKFPQYNLIDVNGKNTAPIYQHLKNETKTKLIKWNFEKFLVDQNGQVVKKYSSLKKPNKIANDIEKLLK
jgi:glutathione peroxidase